MCRRSRVAALRVGLETESRLMEGLGLEVARESARLSVCGRKRRRREREGGRERERERERERGDFKSHVQEITISMTTTKTC